MTSNPSGPTSSPTNNDTALITELKASFPTAVQRAEVLQRALADRAAAHGILDVAYRTIDSPVGCLLLAATDIGLVRIAFAIEDHEAVLQALSTKVSPRILCHPARLDLVARELDEYFTRRRQVFDLSIDWQLSSGFRSAVLRRLPDVAYGTTASYAMVAELAGNPKAVRAVGTACATNPIPVVVPCHRVVRSDGGIGGYLGGIDAKAALLTLESA